MFYFKILNVKAKLGILALFISINCFAHKDKVVNETYGNVIVYMKTGFEYLDIDKIQVIGQLSQELSERLQYKDTILLEYVHDCTDEYTDDLFILESNDYNFKLNTGIKSDYKTKSTNNGLAVRIYANEINVVDVLKLVEYSIKNNEKINSYLTRKSIRFNNAEDRAFLGELISDATDDDLIESIILSNPSDLVKNIINKKILIKGQENYGIEIYWQNDKFLFEYKHFRSDKQELVFEIKDYFYHLYVNVNDVLVFVDKNSFYFLDGTDDKEKKLINIDNASYIPLGVIDFADKLLLYNYWNRSEISIFLKEKDKVISKFE
jgi:hypothetical protein